MTVMYCESFAVVFFYVNCVGSMHGFSMRTLDNHCQSSTRHVDIHKYVAKSSDLVRWFECCSATRSSIND